GAYVLDVGFSYVDYEGSDHTASEVIGLLVSREVSIVINPITVITSTVVGETIPFSVEVINAGDATLNVGNVEVVSGRYMDVVEGATTYVGPLDAGGPFPIDADLLPVAPTEGAAVEVVVHYTDDFNRQQRYVESYEFEIAAAPEVPVDELAVETLDEVPMWRRVLKGFFGLGASAPPAVPQTGLRGFPDGPGAGASSGAAIEIETAP
ncbi:MAG: hypothetical protein ACK2T6_01890, partial [Anaerolineae bacterium]